jgi:hypothetical protein
MVLREGVYVLIDVRYCQFPPLKIFIRFYLKKYRNLDITDLLKNAGFPEQR